MKLACISDTHSLHRRIPDIPDGDVLIHAGDCLGQGTLENIEVLNDWLGTLPHRYKIVIAGNHDWAFQETPELARQALTNAIYLEDSGVEIEGIRFWGSPWTPTFMDWAFMLERGQQLHKNGSLYRAIPMCSLPTAHPKVSAMRQTLDSNARMLAALTCLTESRNSHSKRTFLVISMKAMGSTSRGKRR